MDATLPDLSVLRRCWKEYSDSASTHEIVVGDVRIGGATPVVIAGPCTVESYDQTLAVARAVRHAGAHLLRGGAYKPRTNPHTFQGLGAEALEILAEVRRVTGMAVVTEVLDPRLVEKVAASADMIQIGSRSMQNFPLLTEAGRCGKPVLLKRGWSSTLEEWLCAAEYIALAGNRDIVLCERGIRSACHWEYATSVLDLNVIDPLKSATPLPVIVDPSHATGNWKLVAAMSHAALAVGAHGLLVEALVHEADRATLRCDAEQAVPASVLSEIVETARTIGEERRACAERSRSASTH